MVLYRANCRVSVVVLLMWALAPLQAAEPEEPKTTLTRTAAWTTVFAEEDVKIGFTLQGEEKPAGRVLWSLATSEGLPLAKGEVPVAGADTLEIRVKFPNVKQGVVLVVELTARYYRPGEREPAAQYRSPLYIYPSDPWHDRVETWKERKIRLYDPVGITAKTFEQAKIPYEQLHNLAAIGELRDGIAIVGEGVSFREDRALPELLVTAATSGVPVLCLAPTAGEFDLPRVATPGAGITRLSFKPAADIRLLDKRLDDRYWMNTAVAAKQVLTPGGRGSQIALEVEAGEQGWSWMELEFAPPARSDKTASEQMSTAPTKLIVFSLPVIEHWQAGPTPRFLLLRLMDSLITSPVEPAAKGKTLP